jgi:hypothetical protein
MGSPPALIEPKSITCWGESRSSSSSPIDQVPCFEKYCYTRRVLVLLFKSFWSDLASTWWTPTIFPETDAHESEVTDYNRMESPRIPLDIIPAQRNQVDRQMLFR